MDAKWCIYSGDVNQDGLIDLSDMIAVDNDNLNYVTGYTITDVNGDGLVDLSDLIIVDNNNINYINKQVPLGAMVSQSLRKQSFFEDKSIIISNKSRNSK